MDVLPAHLNRDSFRDSFKGLVALEITIDLPIGFPINNIISHGEFEFGRSARGGGGPEFTLILTSAARPGICCQ